MCVGFVGRLGLLTLHCGHLKAVAVKQCFQRRRRDQGSHEHLQSKLQGNHYYRLWSHTAAMRRLAAVMPKMENEELI